MNHLVLAHPRDDLLLAQAAGYFGTPTLTESHANYSFGFFASARSFFREPVDGVCVCGNVLNPEVLEQAFSMEAFDEIDGVCVAAKPCGGRMDLMTDRLGFFPLYRLYDGERTVFSTQLDFLALTARRLSVDATAWGDLFHYGFCLNGRSLFREIRRVPHGMHVRVGPGLAFRQYEDYLSTTPEIRDLQEAVGRCEVAFDSTIERYRRFSTRIAVPLSGGTDSRLCAGLVSRKQPVTCFSTSKDVGVFGDHGEIAMARRVAEALGASFEAVAMPEDYFRRHFESTLLATDYQTTIHTWYGELMEGIPPRFESLVEGLGDTGFKYDYISPRMLRLVRQGRWKALGASLERLYRLLLVDRLSQGEECAFFEPAWREEMARAKERSFAQQFSALPRNSNLPINLMMHTRFRRLIGPSVYQILGQRFNVFSPYLSRPVNELLWKIDPSVKRDLRLMNAFFSRCLPEVHPGRIPTTTAAGVERTLEMAAFDVTGILPHLTEDVAFRSKPYCVRRSVQYSEDTLSFLHGLLADGDAGANGGELEPVLRAVERMGLSRQIDVAIRLTTFALWHRRYFRGGAEGPGRIVEAGAGSVPLALN